MSKRIRLAHILTLTVTLLTLPISLYYYYYHHRPRPSPLSTRHSYLRYFPPNPNFTDNPAEYLPRALARVPKSILHPAPLRLTSGITNEILLTSRGYAHITHPLHPFCPPMNGPKSACLSVLSNVYVNDLGTAISPASATVYEIAGGCCSRDWTLHLNTTQKLPSPSAGFPARPVLILNGHHSTTYHHVFHDVLPRYLMFLRFLETQPDVLIGLSAGTLVRDLLALIGVPRSRIVEMRGWTHVPLALYPPSVFGHKPDMYGDDVERGCARVVAEGATKGFMERLHAMRARGTLVLLERATRRDVLGGCREQRCAANFAALRAQLEDAFRGVIDVVVYPARASVTRAVRTFRHARMVVGVHGGGFQNIMFCKEGTVVIHVGWDQHYRDVAMRFGLKYYFSEMAELARESRSVRLNVEKVVRDAVGAARKEGILPS